MAEEKKAGEAGKRKVPKGRHLSSIKRHRQSLKRNERNSQARGAMRTAMKRVIDAVKKKDAAAAKTLLQSAVSKLSKAGRKNLVHHRHASRHIGRLSAMVAKLG
ncbi:MAG TPA: 30S ribosomal protein S20 [bacterium]|nr:30S ribosomal protein S20 [bacterium]